MSLKDKAKDAYQNEPARRKQQDRIALLSEFTLRFEASPNNAREVGDTLYFSCDGYQFFAYMHERRPVFHLQWGCSCGRTHNCEVSNLEQLGWAIEKKHGMHEGYRDYAA